MQTWAELSWWQKWMLLPYALATALAVRALAVFATAYPLLCRPLAGVLGAASLILGALFAGAHFLARNRQPRVGTWAHFGLVLLGALFLTAFLAPFNLGLLGALGPPDSATTRVMGVEVHVPWLDKIAFGIFWLLIFAFDFIAVTAWVGVAVSFFRLLVTLPEDRAGQAKLD